MKLSHRSALASTIALGALALPAAADAHVTVQPNTAAAGAFTVENVRVPNETDNAVTTKVDVQMPPGFAEASYQSTPGWTVKVAKRKLATPVKTDDGEVTEEVARITWTARSRADGIQPGQFRDFPLSVQIPGKAGATLTFKALQTYSDGKVVRWIGAPDADQPAPAVSVTAAAGDAHAAPAATTTTASTSGDGSSDTLSIIALAIGGLGLVAGGTALALTRRRTAASI
jgi:periplasmic copper chaperone A